MLDLGVLKIILGCVFFLCLAPVGALTLRGPILIPVLTLRGKANLYITSKILPVSAPDPNIFFFKDG